MPFLIIPLILLAIMTLTAASAVAMGASLYLLLLMGLMLMGLMFWGTARSLGIYSHVVGLVMWFLYWPGYFIGLGGAWVVAGNMPSSWRFLSPAAVSVARGMFTWSHRLFGISALPTAHDLSPHYVVWAMQMVAFQVLIDSAFVGAFVVCGVWTLLEYGVVKRLVLRRPASTIRFLQADAQTLKDYYEHGRVPPRPLDPPVSRNV